MVRELDNPVAAGLPNERKRTGRTGDRGEDAEPLGREVIERIGTDQDLVEINSVMWTFQSL
jgi:hypothetical protein